MWRSARLALTLAVSLAGVRVQTAAQSTPANTRPNPADWQIPDGASDEKSPLQPAPDTLKKGNDLFAKNCQHCHGPEGKGDGPLADRRRKPADLSDPELAASPDGVTFYKIWNGRKGGMPAFKSSLEKNEVWTVLEFVKTLRKP